MSNKADVDKWLSDSKCLTWLTYSENKNCEIDYYRCNQVCRANYQQCPVRAKIEKPEFDTVFSIYFTTWDHEHSADTEKMSEEIKAEIIQQHRHQMRPIRIFEYMNNKFGKQFHYNLSDTSFESLQRKM